MHHSDGLLDFVVALAGHPRQDIVPVERFSGHAGEIVSAHAEADHRGGTYVSGSLHNGFGYSEIYDAHVDVRLLDANRQLIAAWTTDYFPRPIPSDYHGTTGRAWFSIRLPFVPVAGSTIQVGFQRTARSWRDLAPADNRKSSLRACRARRIGKPPSTCCTNAKATGGCAPRKKGQFTRTDAMERTHAAAPVAPERSRVAVRTRIPVAVHAQTQRRTRGPDLDLSR